MYMAQNIDSMEKPKEPTLAEVEEHYAKVQNEVLLFSKVSESVLVNENHDLSKKVKYLENQLIDKNGELRN